jgi:MYXO-CTERM domain-containing protein
MRRTLPLTCALCASVALAATFTRHAALAEDRAEAARDATATPARFRGLPAFAARAAAPTFAERDGHIEAHFAASPRAKGMAKVELPTRANAPFRVTDETSGVGVAVAWLDAPSFAATVVEGGVAYAGDATAPAVLHRVSPFGTEDFVAFASAPAAEVLRYDVELGDGVAGLRLVSGVLELLDASGAPRLRATAPYGIDANGARFGATLAVVDCAVDTSPAAPWSRPVTAPGARRCEVDVTWHGAAYPLVVDPGWMSTHVMATARSQHAGALLMNGQLLVSGGAVANQNPQYTASAELYDAASGTWATTGSMPVARGEHSETALSDGTALVVGGDGNTNDPDVRMGADIYDPTSGGWTAVGQTHDVRLLHTATLLQNGKVLVAGGLNLAGTSGETSAELYNPVSQIWAVTGDMPSGRVSHAAALLSDGRVLVAGGGQMNPNTPVTDAALYDPAAGTWAAANPMNDPRLSFTMTTLQDGTVLSAGGYAGGSSPASYLASAEVFDPTAGTWTETPVMPEHRQDHGAVRLRDGTVLVAGGSDQGGSITASALFDPTSGSWSDAGSLATGRYEFALVGLTNGDVLAAGGANESVMFLDTCELYTPPPSTGTGGGGGSTTGATGTTTSTGATGGSTSGPSTTGAGASGQGGSTSSSGMACVPGQQVACACAGGSQGVQVCDATGDAYGMCTGCADAGTQPVDDAGSSGGCGCHVGDDDAPHTPILAALGLLLAAAIRSRRRARSGSTN